MNASQYLNRLKPIIDREYWLQIEAIKGAAIVETRLVKDFGLIAKNHLHFLPKQYGLTVFCSNTNAGYIEDQLKEVYGVNMVNIGNSSMTALDYNNFLTSKTFWDLIPYQKTLIFQTDSLLLRKGIEKFEKYDYIGACWGHMGRQVGNGGLSLRTNKLMKAIIETEKYNANAHGNEDVYFSKRIEAVGGLKPSCEIANTFAIETMYYSDPIGAHAIEKWLAPHLIDGIFNRSINEL